MRDDALDDDDDIDAVDLVDEELFPIFREEGEELLPQLQSRMRDWARRPAEAAAAAACMRTLHTFKGGARLAGAMRLGEMAHRLETAIEHLLANGQASSADVEALLARVDAITGSFELLGRPLDDRPTAAPLDAAAPVDLVVERRAAAAEAAAGAPSARSPSRPVEAASAGRGRAAPGPDRRPCRRRGSAPIDWSRFKGGPARAGAGGRQAGRPARPRCACVRRCSTGWSTRPARSASRARASNPTSARSRARSAT